RQQGFGYEGYHPGRGERKISGGRHAIYKRQNIFHSIKNNQNEKQSQVYCWSDSSRIYNIGRKFV
ncbi:MAG: hypothetical protein K2F69_00890, partial [Bacteroidaceae bacterium]|nr:hypothetical protein [Bacteroidaceae bacterium]